ncbi:MAG: hypothetical protein D8M58_00025 [Calditrichaeota bacterium]|nr:MAG: hypothetical protein DWQ03_07055 [Calditrichota bacterium]MBL1203755.1 hypothetical protein [Calditrichota bacterium]NOG43586.1 hypothetical protein [Calditrichota bacterium]
MSEKVEAVKIVYPHFDLNIASRTALRDAKNTNNKYERFHYLMTSMLFCSFTIEAYVNHVGNTKIKYWSSIKKNIGSEEKIEILASIYNYKLEKGKRPFQTLKSIIQFRNLMVHAQSEMVTEHTDMHNPITPLAKWEKKVTQKNAEDFSTDTELMLRKIQEFSGMIIDPIQAGSATTFGAIRKTKAT